MDEEAAAMAVSVPYDVVLEILLRVKDVVTLFRCATTCKGWRQLLSADPSFLRRCLPEDVCRSAPFAGFFTQQRPRRGLPVPCLLPAPRPVLDPRCRPLSSFVNLDDHRYFDHAIPLASRHGLLLVRLDLYRAGIDPDASGDLLAVCNLLAGTIHVLPRLERSCDFDDHDVTGYAILTGADRSNNNDQQELVASFKVLVIGILASGDGNMMLYGLRTFSSSGEPRWNTCTGSVKCSNFGAPIWQHSAAVCRGTARWLFWGPWGFYAFDVNVETNNFSFTRIGLHDLHPQYEPYISVDSEGRLALFFMQRNGPQLQIWTLDNNNRIWSRARVLELKQANQQEEQPLVGYTCLGEKSGTLIIKDSFQHV
ncbi:hypothetical protein ACQ4PT_026419 [Festuca glaucescens]